MAYNITGANPKILGPTHRVKTGDFRDAFAREANRRRNEARTRKARIFNEEDNVAKPYHEQKCLPWFSWLRRTKDDEERLRDNLRKQVDENSDLRVHRMRIPIAWSRIPIGGEKETLFLATDEKSQIENGGQGGQTMHWIHMQHYAAIDFDTFKSTALDGINIPANAKNMIQSWMSDIYSLEAQRIFGGKALDSCFQKQRVSSLSGQSFVCVFFAVPYLLLSDNCRPVEHQRVNPDLHPIRALVQSAYRTDSSFTRERSQAVRKVLNLAGNALVYVPHVWGLIIGDYYLATCAPSQVHTHRQSSIVPLTLKEFPPALRLIREGDGIFYINLMECPTWFDFLIRIHHIYSCWLKRHVDAERCEFYDAETDEALDVDSWPSVLYKARAYGVCMTVMVVLDTRKVSRRELDHENDAYFIEPVTDTRTWVRVSKRFIDVETLDDFNLPWEEDVNDSTMVIIKTYLDVDFTEVLFEHTRRSRRMRGEEEVRELSDNEDADHKSVSDGRKRKHIRLPWHWPGCSEKDPADELRRAEGEMFWAPRSSLLDSIVGEDGGYESPQPTHDLSDISTKPSRISTDSRAENTISPYLSWPLASEISALSRNQDQKTVTRIPESRIAQSWKHDPSLVAPKYLYAILQQEEAFAKLPRAKKTHLVELQDSFFNGMSTETYYPEIELCNRVCHLVDHFLLDSTECLLKDKIYGGLHTILQECVKISWGTKRTRLPQLKDFADQSARLLKLSSEIRAGIQTDTSRLPLFTAHIECFKELCRAIGHLCCFIQHALSEEYEYMATPLKTVHQDPNTLDKDPDLDSPTENIPMAEYPKADMNAYPGVPTVAKPAVESEEIPRSISPFSKRTVESLEDDRPASSHRLSSPAASTARSRSIENTSLPPRPRVYPQDGVFDDRESEKREPEDDKNAVLDGCQALKKAEDLLMESKYSIICTLIETNPLDIDDYLSVGPSRIVSSIFEHVSLGLSDLEGTGSFRLEEIYREYSSQLRIKVRDKPTRILLDDLDLLEEELECILSIIQKQRTVLEKFMDFLEHNIFKSKRGPKDVIQNSIRELNDKADLYSEMNSSIEKLRRRVVRQVDLQQDNNSKAVLIFTIVTVVFLPLSFMTSYLGMNTRDIRDMDRDQRLFWATAVPLTLFIVGVCMVVAYGGEWIGDVIAQSLVKTRRDMKRARADI